VTAELAARSTLAERADDLVRLGARELPFLSQVSLRLDPSLAGLLPFSLPLEPNTFTTEPSKDSLWLGPGEWLIVAPAGTAGDVVAELDAALDGVHRSVVDVSANRAAIELPTGRARDLLETGCGLDLDPRVWREGMCAQTLFARAQVVLQHRGASMLIFVRPSFADYLVDRSLAGGGEVSPPTDGGTATA
jgi:sarcosine oxidase, subunit gamma